MTITSTKPPRLPLPTLESLSALRQLADFQAPRAMQMGIEAELARLPHLPRDIRTLTRAIAPTYQERLAAQCASELLATLPGPDECAHLLISGRFALADLIPAVLMLAAPATIDALYIATLGFSKRNITALCELLDKGHVGMLRLLASHYFAHTSTPIYDFAATELGKREPKAKFRSVRTHAKVLAIQLTDGRTVVVETSANLRSCKNIEQMSVFGDPNLFRFHREWIEGLIARMPAAPHAKESNGKDTQKQKNRRAGIKTLRDR